MTAANKLLLWLSARRKGSWSQYRSMVSDLGLDASDNPDVSGVPVHLRLKFTLEALGHVDFFGEDAGLSWRVPPPVFAITRRNGDTTAVLCGARSLPLMAQLRDEFGTEHWVQSTLPEGPDSVQIRNADGAFLARVAERAGVRLQWDAPVCLLSCLDPISRVAVGPEKEMPFGRDVKVERFAIQRRRYYWEEVDTADTSEETLFRCSRWQVPEYFLSLRGATFATSGQAGKYFLLHRRGRHVLRYDAKTHELTMPAICRPPLLVDRALTLCSGALPVLRERYPGQPGMMLHYSQINPEVAGAAAEVLNQSLP